MIGRERRDVALARRSAFRALAAWAAGVFIFLSLAGDARSQAVEPAAPPGAATPLQAPLQAAPPRLADFRDAVASPEARELAHWAVQSGDHGNYPFMVIDKVEARVYVFDNGGVLRGATAALLGTAIGDDSVPGIGQRKLSSIRPHERTTPAGRFMGYLDRDIHGEEVLWIDYETAFSLHRIPKGHPSERRAERMASATPADNRITYGCINVPVAFYETVVSPLLRRTQAVVYVLPETRPARVVFNLPSAREASVPVPDGAASLTMTQPLTTGPARTVASEGASLAR